MKYQKILLIDDDEEDQDIFLSALKELNSAIQFEGIYDAVEALEKLSKREVIPDAIFLDLNMPVMNGLQFLSHVKSNDGLKAIPVIIYTTSSQTNTIRLAKELGAHDFITKPNKYKDLVNILRTIFS